MNDLKKYSPQFKHINDALAFVVHLSFLSQNCKLIGLSEEQYLDDLGSIPQGWNKSNEIYQFRYIIKSNNNNNNNKNNQTILVKILSMGSNLLLITAVKQHKNNVLTLDVNLTDHIDVNKGSKNLNDYDSIYKDINGLLILINDSITNKLLPKKDNKEQKVNDNKKKKPNPLIYPDPNPNPNPLLIGSGGGINPYPSGGGFGGDIDPLNPYGGNLMGPNQINQQNKNNNKNKFGIPNPNQPPFPGAKFDPFGPNGGGGPDPDHFRPPRRGPGSGGFGGGFGGII